MEITRRNHSSIACSRHLYMGVVLRAHPVRGESHIQRKGNREIQTTSPPFHNELHRSHVLLSRLHLERLSHPGHSTILLRSEALQWEKNGDLYYTLRKEICLNAKMKICITGA